MRKWKMIIPAFLFVLMIPNVNAVTYINSCGQYMTHSETYILTADIINASVAQRFCIRLGYNTTLDCQGYKVDGDLNFVGLEGAGIHVGGRYVTIKNCILSDWNNGIRDRQNVGYGVGPDLTIDNVTVYNSRHENIIMDDDLGGSVDNFVIKNSRIYDNGWTVGGGWSGVGIGGANGGLIENSYIYDNDDYGILSWKAQNIVVKNSVIENNILGAFLVNEDYGSILIYNNFLNESTYLTVFDSPTIDLNTTRQSGTNIVNGPELGGNYYTNSTGSGFSDTCTDADFDGFCDSSYNVDGTGYYDNLPLVYFVSEPPEPYACPNQKDCSIYSGTSAGDMLGGAFCGLYNLLDCIAGPYTEFTYMVIAVFFIISLFSLMAYILSAKD